MKALFINGSPHVKGCTKRALEEVEKILKEEGFETDWLEVGTKDVRGCIGCYYCTTHQKCVFNDIVNESASKLEEADAVIIGTPVYYAGPNGQLHSFLDRYFFSTATSFPKTMKVGATVVSSRRAGSTSAFDDINKYFTISSMPIAPSTYWNEVHGFTQEDVEKDLEGLQCMRNLGRNIAFLVKAIKLQAEKEGGMPQQEKTYRTNFFQS
ncbi:MAG: flavodoxin family protein [Muribaculaceae bacterium]|nr:flavodoxin family protein [Muribaculaceae bacterium]